MRVIGIDPGYDRLGVAVLERADGKDLLLYSHCIQTSRNSSIPERLFALGEELQKCLKTYSPEVLGIETLFFNTNQKTAIAVAEARGIVLYLAQVAKCRVREVSPQEVKVAVTGYGKSDKVGVRSMLPHLVTNTPTNALDDEYDAIAVAVTCLAIER